MGASTPRPGIQQGDEASLTHDQVEVHAHRRSVDPAGDASGQLGAIAFQPVYFDAASSLLRGREVHRVLDAQPCASPAIDPHFRAEE